MRLGDQPAVKRGGRGRERGRGERERENMMYLLRRACLLTVLEGLGPAGYQRPGVNAVRTDEAVGKHDFPSF